MNAVACAALVAMTMGHPGGVEPKRDAVQVHRHAKQLSEACLKRRGHALPDAGCPMEPEAILGPYSWETVPVRQNVTEGLPGIPLQLRLTVVSSETCEPVSAAIEIWNCDVGGLYSHFLELSMGTGTATDNSTFMRGIQRTNRDGVVVFDTIIPGIYIERTTHIHVRVHTDITVVPGGYTGGTIDHVGQVYFSQAVMDAVDEVPMYAENPTVRTSLAEDRFVMRNEADVVYGLLDITEMYEGKGILEGAIGTATVGVLIGSTPVPYTFPPTPTPTAAPTPATPTPTSAE